MVKDWLNTAIVGTGRIYFDGHEAIYKQGKPFAPIAFVDYDEKRALKAKETLEKSISGIQEDWAETALQHLKVYTSFEKMLDEMEGIVDFIDNCTHTEQHIPLSIKALERNIHVQSEKPPALNWIETKALVEAEKKSKAFFQLAEHVCFERNTLKLRDLVTQGKIGNINYVEVNFGHGGPYWPYMVSEESGLPHFVDPFLGGGGTLQDLGPHGISRAFWALGDDIEIIDCNTSILERRVKDRKLSGKVVDSPVEDFAVAEFTLKNPQNNNQYKMKITTSWCGHPGGDRVLIKGQKGKLRIAGSVLIKNWFPVRIKKDQYPPHNSKIRETYIFADHIFQNKKSLCDSEYSLKLQEIISLHYYSKMMGKTTSLQEMNDWGDKILAENNNDWKKASREIIKQFAKVIDL